MEIRDENKHYSSQSNNKTVAGNKRIGSTRQFSVVYIGKKEVPLCPEPFSFHYHTCFGGHLAQPAIYAPLPTLPELAVPAPPFSSFDFPLPEPLLPPIK